MHSSIYVYKVRTRFMYKPFFQYIYILYTPRTKLPFRFGKGSKAALEGAAREHGGVLREQQGSMSEQEGALWGSAGGSPLPTGSL